MKCSVYIAASVDGFIAKKDGSVDWLHTSGNNDVDPNKIGDMGWHDFINSVDCIIMGRNTIGSISKLSAESLKKTYSNTKIYVLSNTLKNVPDNLKGCLEIYSGDLKKLMTLLEEKGHKQAYVDGGKTIQSFLDAELIDEMSITQIPVLLGEGIPLFGKTKKDINLRNVEVKQFANDFVQVKYTVEY